MDQEQARPKVLVVDDNDEARLLTVLTLEERGFVIVEADCGEQALACLAADRPDVILLDALMPGMDGFETCRRIRSQPASANLPILMLTGLDDEGSISRAYEAGATDFFIKSNHWMLLAQRIRYLLRASRDRDELVQSRAKEASALRIAHLGYWEWNSDSRRFVASEECFRVVGRPAVPSAYAMDMSVCDMAQLLQHVHADDRVRVQNEVATALAGVDKAKFECGIIGVDDVLRSVRIEFEVERSTDGLVSRIHGVVQDLTERKTAEDRIRLLTDFDPLTGLPNRQQFNSQFARMLESAQRDSRQLALLCVDVDRLKKFNDTLGHSVGDQLLVAVASRLEQSIRERNAGHRGTDFVARLGSDEFVMLVQCNNGEADVQACSELVLATLRQPIRLVDQECITSASIGFAMFPDDGTDTETLMRHADIAKNAAKDNGRNTVVRYQRSLSGGTRDRLMLEQALHGALDRNELVMYYQPQVDMRLGKIIGAEALMRWQRDGKLVPPGDFINIAEEIGLIVPFGEWALDSVVAQNRRWINEGFDPLPVAVNVPGGHFERANLVGLIQDILKRHALAPEFLELEITETTLMGNLSSALSTLDTLTGLGMRLSVDDFGTGYSSLSYLRRLPIDTLKIDASFVRELLTSPDNEAIVTAIIGMARSLNLRVIAEGVETVEQLNLLRKFGCHIMQGYYFSRPIPAADFARYRREFVVQTSLPSRPRPERTGEPTVALQGAQLSHGSHP